MAVAGLAIGLGLQEAGGVADLPAGERERVQHRDAVEPVPERPLSDIQERRRHPDELAREPFRDPALHLDPVEPDLVVEAPEPEAAAGGTRRTCSGIGRALHQLTPYRR